MWHLSDPRTDVLQRLPISEAKESLIIVIAGAIAAAVKELIDVALGNLSYGSAIANAASIAILVIGVFAALDQLQIAEDIVNGLFYALLAIIVGTVIVAVGGSGVTALRPYWARALNRADEATSEISDASEGASDCIEAQAQKRAAQAKQATDNTNRGGATSTN